jgi:hypothetical protein
MVKQESFLGITFDRHISVGHILTTVSIIVAGVWWASDASARIAGLEKFSIYLEKRIESETADRRHDMTEIKGLLKEIRDELKEKADKP